ncbi:MAG: response regulator [Candidatus Omnitrophica bacterium]|nr:response regulator [Candidatus Omnitrophota bacterium]
MPKKVLLIEDEESLVELLKFRLEASGYGIETALDGEEGINKIKELKPDLVILDITMPKMHGYDVCRLAKANEETRDIPIIMLTAHAQKKDIEEAMESGADTFISKPFEPKDLLEKIEKLLK